MSAKGLNNMSRNPKYNVRPGSAHRTIQELVSTLCESELRALNQCVVEHLRILQQQRAQQSFGWGT